MPTGEQRRSVLTPGVRLQGIEVTSVSNPLSLSRQGSNVDKVLRDVMGHGNAAAGAILPGLTSATDSKHATKITS